jgi:signal transduction histidine kinase
MELHIDPVDLNLLLTDLASSLQPAIRENKNKFVIDNPEKFGVIETDVAKLRQVLLNIITNANKFTQNGKITIYGGTEQRDENRYATIHVKDTGIGIEADDLDVLFHDFSQVDQSRNRRYEGTGLGLAISQRYCKLLGGEITVESTPGEGSIFTVHIPSANNKEKHEGLILASNDG